jgi:hypothetical protein
MAADAIVGQAGRSGVTLILNESCNKKALEWDWDKLPDYDALKHLTADQITRKVDWCIHHKGCAWNTTVTALPCSITRRRAGNGSSSCGGNAHGLVRGLARSRPAPTTEGNERKQGSASRLLWAV